MNTTLNKDVLIEILEYLNTEKLISLELVCTDWKNIIRNHTWFDRIAKIPIRLIKTHNFKKLVLSCYIITHGSVKNLGNCHTLYLTNTKITSNYRNILRSNGVNVY